MPPLYFIPGPSQLAPTLSAHLEEALRKGVASVSHRSKAFEDIYKNTTEKLRILLGIPTEYHIWFLSSSTEIWERLCRNCIDKGSFHLVNGSFSRRFSEYPAEIGLPSASVSVPDGNGFSLSGIHIPADTDFVAVTVCETSTGVWTDPNEIQKLKSRAPNIRIVADVVSAVPQCQLDIASCHAVYFSVQKGFGLPAGLGVLIAHPDAVANSEKLRSSGRLTGPHHSFSALAKYSAIHQTPSTPNVLFIYLLGEIASDMLKIGLDRIRKEGLEKAATIARAIEDSSFLEFFVAESGFRSPTVTVANVEEGSEKLLKYLVDGGFVVGNGYGSHKGKHIRIANFPAHSVENVAALCHAIRKFK